MVIQTGKLFTLDDDMCSISERNRWRIKDTLRGEFDLRFAYELDAWGLEWSTSKEKGSIVKRARSLAHKNGHVLPDKAAQRLGELAEKYSSKRSTHYFDFTQDFDWKAGHFGDSGSCFWEGRCAARENVLPSLGAYAVRFFDACDDYCYSYYNGYKGEARAWLVPVWDEETQQEILILFNAYSRSGDYFGGDAARILAKYWSVEYKEIELTATGGACELLYINGAHGWAIGKSLEGIDGWDIEYDEPDSFYCECCNEAIYSPDDVREGPGGDTLCRYCYDEHVSECECCCSSIYTDSSVSTDDGWLCVSCYDRYYERCDWCEEVTLSDSVENGVCEYCASRTFICSNCEERYLNDRMSDECDLCCDCNACTFVCVKCDERLDNTYNAGDGTCKRCKEEENED